MAFVPFRPHVYHIKLNKDKQKKNNKMDEFVSEELRRITGFGDKTTQYKNPIKQGQCRAIGPLLDLVGDKERSENYTGDLGLVMPLQCQSQSRHDWMAPC